MFVWPAWLTSGFSGKLALEICFILSFVYSYVILFEPNKYILLLLVAKPAADRAVLHLSNELGELLQWQCCLLNLLMPAKPEMSQYAAVSVRRKRLQQSRKLFTTCVEVISLSSVWYVD